MRAVQAIGVGPFGHSFLRELVRCHDDVDCIALGEDLSDVWSLSDAASSYILATWRPIPSLCERIGQMSLTRGKPFLPVVLESNRMTVGPVVIPGGQSCWQCYVKRSLQHSHASVERSTLQHYYASHPGEGPGGHLRAFAVIAAGRCSAILNDLDHKAAEPGLVWSLDLMTRRVSTGILLGVHDCPNCGLRKPAQDRSTRELRAHLAYLWEIRDDK